MASALVLAAVSAIGTGLGSRLVDRFDSEPTESTIGSSSAREEAALISSSATEEISQCATSLFVRDEDADDVVSGAVPTKALIDWPAFHRETGAGAAGHGVVLVSVQGESKRVITLTGIEFEVEKKPRPPGAVLHWPCGGPGTGRFLEVDLDRQPVRIVTSSASKKGMFPREFVGGAAANFRPITFPWTVSVTDPLLLAIVANTKRCYCTWRAFLTWQSGSQTGRIAIDNHGKGYTVVGRDGCGTTETLKSELGYERCP